MADASTAADTADVDQQQAGSRTGQRRDAHQLAQAQKQVTLLSIDRQSLDHLKTQKTILYQAYQFFRQQAQEDHLAGQVGEWLLDNYYVISGAVRQIEQDMPRHYYRQLPHSR